MGTTGVRGIAWLATVVLMAGACGEGEAGSNPATPDPPPTAPATSSDGAGAGSSLTLSVEGLEGHEGRIVLGILRPASAGGPVGSLCLPVDADPWNGSGTVTSASPDDPCDKESPFGEVVDQDGEYSLLVGVYVPGETAPVVCVETTIEVAGATAIAVRGADMVPDCAG